MMRDIAGALADMRMLVEEAPIGLRVDYLPKDAPWQHVVRQVADDLYDVGYEDYDDYGKASSALQKIIGDLRRILSGLPTEKRGVTGKRPITRLSSKFSVGKPSQARFKLPSRRASTYA